MLLEQPTFKTKEIKVLECLHCGHVWPPRFEDRIPVVCPTCRSRNYMKPRQRRAHKKNRAN